MACKMKALIAIVWLYIFVVKKLTVMLNHHVCPIMGAVALACSLLLASVICDLKEQLTSKRRRISLQLTVCFMKHSSPS